MYIKHYKDGNWCILLIYVDDLLITATNDKIVKQTERDISSTSDIRCLDEVKYYLGIEVYRDDGGIYNIKQEKYIKKILTEFGLENAKISKTPIDPGYEEEQVNNKEILSSNEQYQKLIGSLLYIALNSRADISASVAIL